MSDYLFTPVRDDGVIYETVPAPAGLNIQHSDEEATIEVFVDEATEKESELQEYYKLLEEQRNEVREIQSKVVKKDFEGSTQDEREIGASSYDYLDSSVNLLEQDIVPPPYPPEVFSNFLEQDATHFRAIETKVTDALGRKYRIVPKYPVRKDQAAEDDHNMSISEEDFVADCKIVQNLLNNVSGCEDFEDITKKVGMDYYSVGWGAFEVIRDNSGKVAKLAHLPASRLRVLKGWRGFVEITGLYNKYHYYQPFGEKVGKDVPDPFDFQGTGRTVFKKYDPEEDGPLVIDGENLRWNRKNRDTGDDWKVSDGYDKIANEVLYLPLVHPNTRYYGYTNAIPAIAAILNNSYIDEYSNQFFEHNCVPRYAIIVKGAKVDKEFKEYLVDYFKTKVKGRAHQTLIVTLSGLQKNVDIEFRKLDADRKEADFIETRKSNDQVIMTAQGIHPAVLGVVETASLGSGKGMSQNEMYRNRVVLPSQYYFARKLNMLFRLGLGVTTAEIEFDEYDIKDRLTQAQVFQILLQNGSLTINEVRRGLGMGSLVGGDTAFVRIREGSAMKVEDIPDIISTGTLESMVAEQNLTTNEEGEIEDLEIGREDFIENPEDEGQTP